MKKKILSSIVVVLSISLIALIVNSNSIKNSVSQVDKGQKTEKIVYENTVDAYKDIFEPVNVSRITAFGPEDYESVFASSENIVVGKFIKILGVGDTKDKSGKLKQAKEVAAEIPQFLKTDTDTAEITAEKNTKEKPVNPQPGAPELEKEAEKSIYEDLFYYYTVWEVEIVDSVKGDVGNVGEKIQVVIAGMPNLEIEDQAQVKNGEVYVVPISKDARIDDNYLVDNMGIGYKVPSSRPSEKVINEHQVIQKFEELSKQDPNSLEIKEFDVQSQPNSKK
ncbi:hypothetical protein HCJ40_02745 [Listeria sp. FSL L7-0993]|uniref:hypothetical protein n=1 Tax=Listeria cossartiae TaxID=2838249 RepID=UPI0016285C69|nr:hypothetical protein [Listeria cossartiae]MBC1805937.1 hypothetical protein [Listeria cossartiae subsp. cayugensis]